jgi:hypothetical protein
MKRPLVKKGKKFAKVMDEFKMGKLHSGSKHGMIVTNPRQARAIARSEEMRAMKKKPKKSWLQR